VYPYISGGGAMQTCAYNAASATSVDVSTYTDVTPQSVSQMKAALSKQPLAVAIEADQPSFQSYTSGVFNDASCGTTLDHAVLAVGYGTDATTGLDYWLIKNSWNTTWGDKGYIKLQITGDGAGVCGVQLDPEFPTTN
jgi:KDEL-tailed cysteine endopeptidase